ncbi:GDP-L-fucose synthase [Streptomyces sp. RB5]|uniref:GDP-L-fucose synthase n=1 Tax=Streptomyces smaragdinus TaxID=2585196 RepID=A0A7K0CLV5_9ACTN|nr:NAD-dependent epimerase/dehydratase family protein [Streptomyces smaragdinus]MQY14243.1 GDP-L-fucose synthase [Streptomyces smaragdinus]
MKTGRRHWATDLKGSTVLVTGGGGLIGSRIATLLRELGARPLSLCRRDAYPAFVYRELFGVDENDPDVLTGDISDARLVRHAVEQSDYVIHAAALADVAACTREPSAAIAGNIMGTQTLLDAVAASDRIRRFCFVSSASVYGNGLRGEPACAETRTMRQLLESVYGRMPAVFSEYDRLHPLSVYANSKLWGEFETALSLRPVGASFVILRYFSVYGEPQIVKQGSHSWVVAWFAARAAIGLPLHLNGGGHQVRDLVHVDDIAEGTIRALIAPRAHGETINIGTGKPTMIRTVAELTAEHFPDVKTLQTPMPPGDPEGGYAATGHMLTTLNWVPQVSVADGVARYAAWLKQTPQAVPAWLRQPTAA